MPSDDAPIDEPPMRYVYLDESIFAPPNEYVGYGALVSDHEITEQVIQDALIALDNDPDRHDEPAKPLDDRTLAKGYFHGCDDSKNGHSHLCAAINSHVNGVFCAQVFDPGASDEHAGCVSTLFSLTSKLSAMKALNTTRHVHVVFEQRGSLSIAHMQAVFAELDSTRLAGLYDHPYIPTYFPSCSFEVADKKNPGVQCADFMLWATNRHINGRSDWLNRIISRFRTETADANGYWRGADVDLGCGLVEEEVSYDHTDLSADMDASIDREDLGRFWLQAEHTAQFYKMHGLPEPYQYLQDALDLATIGTMDESCGSHLDHLVRFFLMIFDMIPLIQESTGDADRRFLLLARRYLALVLRRDLVNGTTTRHFLQRVRRSVIARNPEHLSFDAPPNSADHSEPVE